MNAFHTRINYSSANEDAASECRALALGPSDHVLCVTGSGARPLDLLTQYPASIVAVDSNPCQQHLLHLKMAAMRWLDYDSFLEFVGITVSARRVGTYRLLRPEMPEASRRFWDARPSVIRRGVLYAGRWERHFRMLATAVAAVRPRLLSRLFDSATLEEQAAYWEDWRRGLWKPFLRTVGSRAAWRHLLRDPGFYAFVPSDVSIWKMLDDALRKASRRILFRKSAFATLLFHGRYSKDGPLPLHLQRCHFDSIRKRLSRIEALNGSLEAVLEKTRHPFSAFSLSDIGSYCDEAGYRRLWRAVRGASAPGARVCERQFLVKRAPETALGGALARNNRLETQLEYEDRSLFYTFVVGAMDEPRDA